MAVAALCSVTQHQEGSPEETQMAKRNPKNPNPDRSPSGNDPNRRDDNANQGTEGGRNSSNKPGHPSRPVKGQRGSPRPADAQ
jgi:hypothetical protein